MGWHRGELALRAATEETAGTRGVEEVKEVMQAAANHEARSESLALVVVARVEQARRWRLEADTGTHCSKRYLTVTVACHPRQQQTPGGACTTLRRSETLARFACAWWVDQGVGEGCACAGDMGACRLL